MNFKKIYKIYKFDRYTAHIWSQAREHLNLNSAAKSATKDHVYFCRKYIQKHFSIHDFAKYLLTSDSLNLFFV